MTSPASISTQSQAGMPSTRGVPKPFVLQVLDDAVGDGADMTLRAAGRDDHGVGERGLAGQVDLDRLFGLHVLEAGQRDGPDVLVLRSLRSGERGKRSQVRFKRRKSVQVQTLSMRRAHGDAVPQDNAGTACDFNVASGRTSSQAPDLGRRQGAIAGRAGRSRPAAVSTGRAAASASGIRRRPTEPSAARERDAPSGSSRAGRRPRSASCGRSRASPASDGSPRGCRPP